jgi:hypothetical protein
MIEIYTIYAELTYVEDDEAKFRYTRFKNTVHQQNKGYRPIAYGFSNL